VKKKHQMQKFATFSLLLCCYAMLALAQAPPQPIDWEFTRLDSVGGNKSTLVGSPRLIDAPNGKAVEFDGESGLFLDINPLTGLKQFTAEVVFQPYTAGPKEQRFLHFQENDTENRLLFEIRLTDDNRWFLDAFIKSGDGNYTLYAEKFPHPIGAWYHAAVVMDGATMRHYVNGIEEMATPIKCTPQKDGRTSIGVRINKVSWYKGAVRRVRITPRVLMPNEFLPH
jgi:Concanavalin A-like lectin/glucanases superfamily